MEKYKEKRLVGWVRPSWKSDFFMFKASGKMFFPNVTDYKRRDFIRHLDNIKVEITIREI